LAWRFETKFLALSESTDPDATTRSEEGRESADRGNLHAITSVAGRNEPRPGCGVQRAGRTCAAVIR
jgi:hypothetical protein